MKEPTRTDWKEPMLILAVGAAGGALSWLYAITIGQPPATQGAWTIFAWMAFGMAASFLGVYLIANTDTRAIYRCLAFALVCGFAWKPTLEAAEALVDKQASASRAQQLDNFTAQARLLTQEVEQVPNEEFPTYARALVTKGQELINLYPQIDDYASRSAAILATRDIVDLLAARTSADLDLVPQALDDLSHSATAVGDLALAQYAQDAQSTRLNWDLASAVPTDFTALGDNVNYLAHVLETASRGKISLNILGPGQAVAAHEITNAVMQRDIQAGYTSLQYDADQIPSAVLLSTRPFGMEPSEYTSWWYDGGGKEIAEMVYAPHNLKPILCGVTGPETGGWFKKPITSIKDFQGLKMSFRGFGAKVMEKLGVSVEVLSGADIYPALEKGIIDAAEYSTPAIDNALGFHQIAKFNYFPAWQGTSSAFHFVANSDLWARLDTTTHALIEMACTAAVVRNLSRSEAIQGAALVESAKKGVVLRTYPESILAEFRRESDLLLSENASQDPMFRLAWESQRKFSDSYRVWKATGYLPLDE